MSIRWMVSVAGVLLLASSGALATRIAGQERTPGHEDLLCRSCHSGAMSDRKDAHVPQDVCTACHSIETLPGDGQGFDHGLHGGAGPVEMGCAGCHHHQEGDARLGAGRETCVLCHAGEMGAGDGEGCRSCHRDLPASVVTTQGVPLPHGVFEWMDDACLRCHYAVSAPSTVRESCAPCHTSGAPGAVTSDADPHSVHVEVACAACHDDQGHRITAMSAAVGISCGDCHGAAHDVALRDSEDASPVCSTCHSSVHEAQQRLFLGVAPGDMGPEPSPKFLAGLSCRGCHVRDASAARHGVDPVSCGRCHESEYGRVADWWTVGGRERVAPVARYLEGARAALVAAGMSEKGKELNRPMEWVALVREGGAQHNPSLSHRLLKESLDRGVDAYRASRTIAPRLPVLGVEPRPGECSYCHYDIAFGELERFLVVAHDFQR